MAPGATSTATKWDVEFDTIRRDRLFRNPPKDRTAYPALADAVRPHIESFNFILEEGGLIAHALGDIGTKIFYDGDPASKEPGNTLSLRLTELFVAKPHIPTANKVSTRNRDIYPSECRERHATYRARMTVRLEVRVNQEPWKQITRDLGQLPLMLKSNRCHLEKLSPEDLVYRKEETDELGGYFIVNGNERLIRMLIVNRRNYPMAIIRPSYMKRGPAYSKFGISIRSTRPDQTSQTNVLHYLTDGNVIFRFSWRKREYLVPVMMILKALVETNDREIFEELVGTTDSPGAKDTFLTDRVELLLRTFKVYGLYSRSKSRSYLGEKFRIVLRAPQTFTNEEVGAELLRKIVVPHLGGIPSTQAQDKDKFRLILFMVRKLYSLVAGDCAVDNPDALQNQELLLGGSLYGMILKEKLEEWLTSIQIVCRDWLRKTAGSSFTSPTFLSKFTSSILSKTNENIGSSLEYFLATGNLVSPTGLDLQETAGFTIVAEKINFYRFISHFRSVHRGSFFAQLKTTAVRKLLPESWGFLCPVHTPDGGPCGLLNHLAHKCRVVTRRSDVSTIPALVAQMGLINTSSASVTYSVVVQLDGKLLGWCSPKQAKVIAETLRFWKVDGKNGVPLDLEIGYIPTSNGGLYPGIFMFSEPSRLIRPTKYLPLGKEDLVGPFEQPFLSIACVEHEIVSGQSTHVEYDPTNILSIIANMTPFSNFNQSPRNMYQCQMGKQSMGTPGTALRYRTDNKTYRLQCGQTPVVRPPLHNEYGLDNFPNGTNAVVAVISYTGYDMDDAMILNKSAHERGFAYGTIYKTKKIDLGENERGRGGDKKIASFFGFAPESFVKREWRAHVDEDGLPIIGAMVQEGDVIATSYAVTLDTDGNFVNRDNVTQIHKYKDAETAYIEEVRLLGAEAGDKPLQAISVKFRVPRSPVIGDKFSSRHGQKGVCSQKWPAIDMPFSETGIQPDIIINPHAFPSRMTIGMFIESLAGKSGALHGLPQDGTPFRFDEENTAGDYFGHQLRKAGFNYHGNEPMYSGITGEEFPADIYVGVVYYQRLRHMVNDKFQVRTTGPVTPTTGQPIKGRSKGGGIRVGEMERDALLAHGAAALLQDRLLNCSDYARAWICRTCGAFLSTTPVVADMGLQKARGAPAVVRCRRCAKRAAGWEPKTALWEDGAGIKYTGGEETTVVAVPGVLKYLDVELAAMGVRLKFDVAP